MDLENNEQQPAVPNQSQPVILQDNQIPSTPDPTPEKKPSGVGPLVAIIIILLVIIAGGLYFWLGRQSVPNLEENNTQKQTDTTPEKELENLEAEFNTEEFDDIENIFDSVDEEFDVSI